MRFHLEIMSYMYRLLDAGGFSGLFITVDSPIVVDITYSDLRVCFQEEIFFRSRAFVCVSERERDR